MSSRSKPLTAAQCGKQLERARDTFESAKHNLRNEMHRNWAELDGHTRHFNWHRSKHPRHKEIGHAIALIMARNRTNNFTKADYELLDTANGGKVRRKSQMPARDYLVWIARYYAGRGYRWWEYGSYGSEPESTEPVNLGFPGCKPWFAPVARELSPVENYLHVKADLEYWEEMTRLASNRETQINF